MKNLSLASFAAFLIFFATRVIAQQEDLAQFCIINAVESDAPLFISVDGMATTETGYVPGEFSGLLGYRTGRAKLEAKCGDLLPLESPLPLRRDARTWLVFYRALVPKEGEPEPVPALQVLAAPEPDKRPDRYNVATVLVGTTAPVSFALNNQPLQLIPGKAQTAVLTSGELTLTLDKETLARRDLEEKGSFLLVIFPRHGSYGHVLIYL